VIGKASVFDLTRRSPLSHRPSRKALHEITSQNQIFKIPKKSIQQGRNNSSKVYHKTESRADMESFTQNSTLLTHNDDSNSKELQVSLKFKLQRYQCGKQRSQDI
jgi:hypothetical protein